MWKNTGHKVNRTQKKLLHSRYLLNTGLFITTYSIVDTQIKSILGLNKAINSDYTHIHTPSNNNKFYI